MRPLLISALAAALAALACTDSVGVGSDCDAEMRALRTRQGPPDLVQEDHLGGNHVERWYYDGFYFTFRWGVDFPACRVEGPTSAAHAPEVAGSLHVGPEPEEIPIPR